MESIKKIAVLGSACYDTFMLVDRSPEMGETISAKSITTACGGKGANQAATVGKLGYNVDFIFQLGNDSSGQTLQKELKQNNVNIDNVTILNEVSTGQAFIFSYPNKNNSIVIVGGANVKWE